MNAFQIVTIFIALIVTGEAAALAVGMHIIQKSEGPWVSLKNDLLLALDVVVGLALIFLAVDSENFPQPIWLSLFIIIGLLTHLFRFWEYLTKREFIFCGNRSLFVVNNLKFGGFLLVMVWGFLI